MPGVAEVNTWGGDEKQIQVASIPSSLQSYGLTFDELVEALEQNNAQRRRRHARPGGRVEPGPGRRARHREPADVERIVVAAQRRRADPRRATSPVVEGHEIRRGAVTADGKGEVVLGLGFMLMGENSHDVTRRLTRAPGRGPQDACRRASRSTPVYDRTELVDHVIDTVRTNLFEGALLVVAVLFAFLGNLRAGLIVASAIPLSMLFAFDLHDCASASPAA